jgi:hypothetical protein
MILVLGNWMVEQVNILLISLHTYALICNQVLDVRSLYNIIMEKEAKCQLKIEQKQQQKRKKQPTGGPITIRRILDNNNNSYWYKKLFSIIYEEVLL